MYGSDLQYQHQLEMFTHCAIEIMTDEELEQATRDLPKIDVHYFETADLELEPKEIKNAPRRIIASR